MGPLSVGNIVSAALVLYRSHLKQYLSIALRAYLWSFIPALVFGPFLLLITTQTIQPSASWLIVLILPLLFYCLAKFLTNSALISRLAFCELTNKPENTGTGRNHLKPYLWSFFKIAIRVGFSMLGVYVSLLFVISLTFGLLGFVLGLVLNNIFGSLFFSSILGVLLIIVGIIALIFGLLRYFSRWIISEVPLAIEQEINSGQSVARSWELTKNSVGRIQLIAVIAFLVTLPIIGITSYIPQIILIMVGQDSPFYWIVYSSSLLTGLVGGILVLPFWQSIKAVLYYDLRMRREGLGMQLRDTNGQ